MEKPSRAELLDDLDAQRDLLATIQFEQLSQLERSGILDKVKRALKAGIDSDIGQPMACVRHELIGNTGESKIIYSVAVANTVINDSGYEQRNFRYVPVAEAYADTLLPCRDFDAEQAQIVTGMVQGLQESKKAGFLPNLSPSCTSIDSPLTAITLYRAQAS